MQRGRLASRSEPTGRRGERNTLRVRGTSVSQVGNRKQGSLAVVHCSTRCRPSPDVFSAATPGVFSLIVRRSDDGLDARSNHA